MRGGGGQDLSDTRCCGWSFITDGPSLKGGRWDLGGSGWCDGWSFVAAGLSPIFGEPFCGGALPRDGGGSFRVDGVPEKCGEPFGEGGLRKSDEEMFGAYSTSDSLNLRSSVGKTCRKGLGPDSGGALFISGSVRFRLATSRIRVGKTRLSHVSNASVSK